MIEFSKQKCENRKRSCEIAKRQCEKLKRLHEIAKRFCVEGSKRAILELMRQKIVGFNQDDEHDWRAMLACGHYQHVRHSPPLNTRSWTQTKAGRESRLGFELSCRKCDEEKPKDF